MSIAGIKVAISTSVNSALGIKCYTAMPSVIAELPCAYIVTGPSPYDTNLPLTKIERVFEITLVAARAEALEDAQAKIETYLLPTGTGSMLVAIKNALVSTDADYIHPLGDTGIIPITYSDHEYIGCRWRAEVMI